MARRFYTPQPLSQGQTIELDDQAAHHVFRVLRMQPGDDLNLFNGDGHDYAAELEVVSKKSVTARLITKELVDAESPLHTHLGQVISKGERMDYAIQKATELGVNQITPLTSERCDVRLNKERMEKRLQHWQQIAISAAEQCGRAVVPEILPAQTVEQWIGEKSDTETGLVLHHRSSQSLDSLAPPSCIKLLIGPEGGLTQAEIEQADQQGFIQTTFGKRVFRTETAPIAALSVVQWLWGDFQ